jgi:hypothetical protein
MRMYNKIESNSPSPTWTTNKDNATQHNTESSARTSLHQLATVGNETAPPYMTSMPCHAHGGARTPHTSTISARWCSLTSLQRHSHARSAVQPTHPAHTSHGPPHGLSASRTSLVLTRAGLDSASPRQAPIRAEAVA